MLDLFVISLTMSLINRDQILAFTMGPAAFYFGAAVILTILAVEWLDSRLLWDAHESGNARFDDEDEQGLRQLVAQLEKVLATTDYKKFFASVAG